MTKRNAMSAQKLVALAEEQGLSFLLAVGQCQLGWIIGRQGEIDNGLRLLAQAITVLNTLGRSVRLQVGKYLLTDILALSGRRDEALALLDEVPEFSGKTGARWLDAELHRRKGELILASENSDTEQAEQAFRQAIDIGREQSARLFESRAATASPDSCWRGANLPRHGNCCSPSLRGSARQPISQTYGSQCIARGTGGWPPSDRPISWLRYEMLHSCMAFIVIAAMWERVETGANDLAPPHRASYLDQCTNPKGGEQYAERTFRSRHGCLGRTDLPPNPYIDLPKDPTTGRKTGDMQLQPFSPAKPGYSSTIPSILLRAWELRLSKIIIHNGPSKGSSRM